MDRHGQDVTQKGLSPHEDLILGPLVALHSVMVLRCALLGFPYPDMEDSNTSFFTYVSIQRHFGDCFLALNNPRFRLLSALRICSR